MADARAAPATPDEPVSTSGRPGRVLVFKRFERFWHWSQAALILVLLFTGFGVHGSHDLMRFGTAVRWHTTAAWLLMGLWVFALFWHLTTGEWRQYVPTTKRLAAVARYYAWGMFHGEAHPYRKTVLRKHNPLQRLAYLVLLVIVSPILWVSGLLYLFRPYWSTMGVDQSLSLAVVAYVHTAGAFMMLAFLVVHVYLTTTGPTPLAHVRAMVTGWDEVDEPGAGS
jgi:thiosulfate reductase cytochrome b subunit